MSSFKYRVVCRKNPVNSDVKFFAEHVEQEQVSEDEMIEQIEQKTTVSRADIRAVLSALQVEIKYNLVNGRKVKLNDIGCFRTTLHSTGTVTEEDFTAGNINHTRVVFTPNPILRKAVLPGAKGVSFSLVKDAAAASQQ